MNNKVDIDETGRVLDRLCEAIDEARDLVDVLVANKPNGVLMPTGDVIETMDRLTKVIDEARDLVRVLDTVVRNRTIDAAVKKEVARVEDEKIEDAKDE